MTRKSSDGRTVCEYDTSVILSVIFRTANCNRMVNVGIYGTYILISHCTVLYRKRKFGPGSFLNYSKQQSQVFDLLPMHVNRSVKQEEGPYYVLHSVGSYYFNFK